MKKFLLFFALIMLVRFTPAQTFNSGILVLPTQTISLKKGYKGTPDQHTLPYSIDFSRCSGMGGACEILYVIFKVPFNTCAGYCITRTDGSQNCTHRTDGMGAMLKNISPVAPSMSHFYINYEVYFDGKLFETGKHMSSAFTGSGAQETQIQINIPNELSLKENGFAKYPLEEFKKKIEIKNVTCTGPYYATEVTDYLNQLVDLDMAGFYGVYRAEGDTYFGGNINKAEHDYTKARTAYKKALQYKPGDEYVTQKLKELDKAEAEQKQQQQQTITNNNTANNQQNSGNNNNQQSSNTQANQNNPPANSLNNNRLENKTDNERELTYEERNKLEVQKIEQAKAERQKQQAENAKQYYQQQLENVNRIEKASQLMETQVTTMVNSYFTNDKIFKSWNEAKYLDISGNDPKALLLQYEQKVQQLKQLTEQKKQNLTAAMQYNISSYNTTNSDPNMQGLNNSVTQLMGMGAQMAADNKEAKAKAELKKQLQQEFDRVKNELVNDFSNSASQSYAAAAGATDEQAEQYYNKLGNYFECRISAIKSSFSYDHTNWMEYNNCTKPSQPYSYGNSANEYVLLDRAKSKYNKYKSGGAYSAQYYKAAQQLTNSAIGKNNEYAEAYSFKAQIEDDPIEAFTSARRAIDLNSYNSNDKTLYTQKLTPFSTAFYRALDNEDSETIKKVLQRGLHNNLTNGTEAPVMYCLKNNKPVSLQLLLANNTALASKSNLYQYLDIAAVNNADKCVKWLIEQNLNPDGNPTINAAYSPLLLACDNNANKATLILIDKKANLKTSYQKLSNNNDNQLKYKLSSMIMEAALTYNDSSNMSLSYKNSPEALKDDYFVKAITDGKDAFLSKAFQLKPNNKIYNAVTLALDEKTLRILARNGYNLSEKNAQGQTPLHIAINNNNTNKSFALVKAGADINVINTDGWTPLQLAVYKKQSTVASLLLSHKVDINAKGAYGWTALHYAVREYSFDSSTIDLLLSYGADKRIKDNWGRTPYNIANERQFTSIKKKLK